MTTIITLYHDTVRRLSAAKLSDPETEATILLRHILKCRRADIFLNGQQTVADDVESVVDQMISRRLTREPLAYILGDQEFYGRSFIVSPAVLIPRQETELLIDKASAALQAMGRDKTLQVIDLGTGSGVIAITLALEHPQITVLAVDRSIKALEVARSNALAHGVSGQLYWLNSDWSFALGDDARYNLVAANPPYVARRDQPTLQPELAAEPELALFGGDDGRDEIVRIISESSRLLVPEGILLMEIGYDQETFVISATRDSGAFDEVIVHRDYAGHPRLLQARKKTPHAVCIQCI